LILNLYYKFTFLNTLNSFGYFKLSYISVKYGVAGGAVGFYGHTYYHRCWRHSRTVITSLLFVDCYHQFVIIIFNSGEPPVIRSKDCQPEFKLGLQNVTFQIGHDVSLECNIIGQPKPKIYWTKVDKTK